MDRWWLLGQVLSLLGILGGALLTALLLLHPDWAGPVADISAVLVVILMVTGIAILTWPRSQARRAPWHVPVTAAIARRPQETTPPRRDEPKRRIAPDPARVALIDQLYPALHDLSEKQVEHMGNVAGLWEQDALTGDAKGYFDRVYSEMRLVTAEYEQIRHVAARNSHHADIHDMIEEIAQRYLPVSMRLGELREKAEKLDFTFTRASLDLVAEDFKALQRAIGGLRTYISQECRPKLAELRREAS
jgi:hypothetical protein